MNLVLAKQKIQRRLFRTLHPLEPLARRRKASLDWRTRLSRLILSWRRGAMQKLSGMTTLPDLVNSLGFISINLGSLLELIWLYIYWKNLVWPTSSHWRDATILSTTWCPMLFLHWKPNVFCPMMSETITMSPRYVVGLCLWIKITNSLQGKIKVDSIDDKEDMQFADEAFDILGFTETEKFDVYKVSEWRWQEQQSL